MIIDEIILDAREHAFDEPVYLNHRPTTQDIDLIKGRAIVRRFIQSLIDDDFIIVTDTGQWITGLRVGEALKARFDEVREKVG